MTDNTTVIACLSGATAIAYVGTVSRKEPLTIRPLIGMFVAGTFLLLVGMWSTSIASAFAIIILATAFILNGKDFFGGLGKATA